MAALRLLLLGSDGQLGKRLRQPMGALGELACSSRQGGQFPCDLTDASAVRRMLDAAQPDLIVNAAAYTAVDRAETEHILAAAVNATLPGILGKWAANRQAAVMHYSTDYVFDGHGTRPYRETDPTSPLNVYGATKLDGELALAGSGCAHLILRVSWLYDATGKNFLTTMLRLAQMHPSLTVVDDQLGAPTRAGYVAEASQHICNHWLGLTVKQRIGLSGTYHLSASGKTSWHGFAKAIFSGLGLTTSVVPIPTNDYPTPAKRPAFSVLDGHRIRNTFGVKIEDWREGLNLVLAELKN